jgi:hypothetical protein
MWRDAEVGSGLDADPQVILGYPAARPVEGPLVMGADARLRSGTVLYAGSVIGARFESSAGSATTSASGVARWSTTDAASVTR